MSDNFTIETAARRSPPVVLSHLEMNAWLKKELEKQFERAESNGWLPHFFEAVETHTEDYFDCADLVAIASRETNLDPKWLSRAGDNGNGFGLMQADRRSFPEFTSGDGWKDAKTGILFGAKVLMKKWREIEQGEGKQLRVFSSRSKKWYSFTGREISGINAQKATIAAYNSGLWSYYAYSNGKSVDSYTTGKNYSRDVMERAAIFRPLIANWLKRNSANSHTRLTEDFADLQNGELLDVPGQSLHNSSEQISDVSPQTESNNFDPDAGAIPSCAPQEETLTVEDYKPFVKRWLLKIWGWFVAVNTVQFPTFAGIGIASGGNYWYVGIIAAVLIFLITLFIVLCASIVLGVILYRNRKEIHAVWTAWIGNQVNPETKNYALQVEKKF